MSIIICTIAYPAMTVKRYSALTQTILSAANEVPESTANIIDLWKFLSFMLLIKKKNVRKNNNRLNESWSNNPYAEP